MNTVKTIQNEAQNVSVFAIIAVYYSRILEQAVTVSQAKSMVNAQCAFVALIMPLELGLLYRFIALLWFAIAVLQCKQRLSD